MLKYVNRCILFCFLLMFIVPSMVHAQPITYHIEQLAPDAAFQRMEYKSYPGPVEGLLSTDEVWTGFFRQEGRKITIDLGKNRKIREISLQFQQHKSAGIVLPRFMEASVSLDGQKWSYLGKVTHSVLADDVEEQTRTLQLSFPALETRYVQINFPVDVWVFARNLKITEVEEKTSDVQAEEQAVILAHVWQEKSQEGNYLRIPGVDNILLLYSGAHGDLGLWTKRDLLPLVTYVNQEGRVQDSFFDTFLFLPFPEVESRKVSWQDYLNGLFQEGEQLDALNDLSLEMQKNYPQLSVRPKVILTLPYPDPQQEKFASNISFSATDVGAREAIANRERAVHDYFYTLMSMWENAQFEGLDLVGIYWYKETMDMATPNEDRLVRYAADLVHAKGQKFYWIPYFGSHGYEQWQDYGFDYVILQPNFYAYEDPPEERMDNVAQLAKKLSLGVELEIDDKVSSSKFYHDLFYKQLDKGHELGLDKESTNAYYMGAKSLLHASKSKLAPVRQIYDDLFKWVKGTYQPIAEG